MMRKLHFIDCLLLVSFVLDLSITVISAEDDGITIQVDSNAIEIEVDDSSSDYEMEDHQFVWTTFGNHNRDDNDISDDEDDESSNPSDPNNHLYFRGIPGTTQTWNGYDAARGNDPICWVGQGISKSEAEATTTTESIRTTEFPNPLVEDFALLGETQLLHSCPRGNCISVDMPTELEYDQERLRTSRYYNYTVHLQLDLSTLEESSTTIIEQQQQHQSRRQRQQLTTDNKDRTVAIQIVLCVVGNSGFCSPFVHEQANARDEYEAHLRGEEVPTTARGSLHGGTHIHSPWVFLDLGNGTRIPEPIRVQVPMIVNDPGEYFVIATTQLYMVNEDPAINSTVAHYHRWDMSNALHTSKGRIIRYQQPAIIQEVSTTLENVSYVIVAVASMILLFLLLQTFYHRNHHVFQLSQGDLLIVFVLSALIATCCTVLQQPNNDLYCSMGTPVIVLCIHFMYAITLGRLWRIHAVLSPVLLARLDNEKNNNNNNNNNSIGSRPVGCNLTKRFVACLTWISGLHYYFVYDYPQRKQNSLRRQVTKGQLMSVVFFFTIPQILLVIINETFFPLHREIEFNEDESIGRAVCVPHYRRWGDNNDNDQDITMTTTAEVVPMTTSSAMLVQNQYGDLIGNPYTYSFALLLVLVITLLLMAYSSRDLPNLFNETDAIYNSTLMSMLLLFLGGGLITLTDSPATSPDITYVVWFAVTISLTLSSAFKIILPKLKLIWHGETITISKIVSDHQRERREITERRSRSGGTSSHSTTIVYGGDSYGGDKIGTDLRRRPDEIHRPGIVYRSLRSFFNTSGSNWQQIKQQEQNQTFITQTTDDGDLKPKSSHKKNGSDKNGKIATFLPSSSSSAIFHTCVENYYDDDNHDEHDDDVSSLPTNDKNNMGSSDKSNSDQHSNNTRTTKGTTVSFASDAEAGSDLPPSQVSITPKEKQTPRVLITNDTTPTGLFLNMLDLQKHLNEVNSRILSGVAVGSKDWEEFTYMIDLFHNTFEKDVQFEFSEDGNDNTDVC